MSVTSLQIKDLFNLISTHFIDNFERFSASTVTNWKSYLDTTSFVTINNNKAFTIINLSTLIEKLFEINDLLTCGDNALRFVELAKNNPSLDKLSWMSANLKKYCSNANLTPTSSPLNIVNNSTMTNTSSIQTTDNNDLESPNNTQNMSELLEHMRTTIQSSVESQIKFFMTNSMSKSIKDEHYQELEAIMNRKIILDNSLTINKQYQTNKVYQNSIKSSAFPSPWIKDDPLFVDKFNKLIITFQTQIQQLNIEHIEGKITTIQKELNNKLTLIKNFDSNADEKSKILESQATKRQLTSLTKSTEKVNKLIVQVNSPNVSTESNLPTNNPRQSNKQTRNTNKNSNAQQRSSTRKTSNPYSSNITSQQTTQNHSVVQPFQHNQSYNQSHSANYNRPQSSAYNYSYRSDIPNHYTASN